MNEIRVGSASDNDPFERSQPDKCPHCDAEVLTQVGRSIMFKCETTARDGIVYKRHTRCRINELEWVVDKLQKRIVQLKAILKEREAKDD